MSPDSARPPSLLDQIAQVVDRHQRQRSALQDRLHELTVLRGWIEDHDLELVVTRFEPGQAPARPPDPLRANLRFPLTRHTKTTQGLRVLPGWELLHASLLQTVQRAILDLILDQARQADQELRELLAGAELRAQVGALLAPSDEGPEAPYASVDPPQETP